MMNLFLFSRTVHRLLVLVISFLAMTMAFTGFFMKYTDLAPSFMDLGAITALHNGLSIWFTITLVLMTISGLFMYFIPYLRTKHQNEQN